MGIPRLRQLLEPYTKRIELEDQRVVIDGPGLAYHVFSLCQARAPSGSLFDQSSYTLLGEKAITWLDDLTSSGAILSALYFDGYLPASKEPERKRRVVDLSKGLQTYFSLYPSGVPGATTGVKRVPTPAGSRSGRNAPVPAFLVPAVLEALRASEKYKDIIKLVPGEADSFCAKHIQSGGGGVVITSDTDLLVHDLGPKGSVTFFNDVEFQKAAGKSGVLISEYSIWRICERLSLPQEKGILSLAFELRMESHLTLNQAMQKSKDGASRTILKQDYTTFIEQYLTPEIAECGESVLGPDDALDPRISELVLKIMSVPAGELPSWASDMPADPRDDLEIPMYLPALVDSPSRTSAWEISTSMRQLAYGITQLVAKSHIRDVAEFRRIQQPTSSGTRVAVCTPASVNVFSSDVVGAMARIRACVSRPELQWIALAVLQDINGSQEQGKGSVLSLDMLQAEANGSLFVTSWDFLHMFAQVQGLYYSIRMIKQVCDFAGRRRRDLPESVVKLRQAISDFPPLAGFPTITTFAELFPRLKHDIDLKKLVAGQGLGDEVSVRIDSILNPKKKSKNKRKRSNKDGSQATAARPSPQSRNMFDLLGSE